MESLADKLRGEKVLPGTMISEIATPNIARILRACGFEFIIIDCEHGYFDLSQVAAIVGISNGIGLSVIIRLPDSRRELITKFMDMGADGLLLPMTSSAADIRPVVRYAKYAPLGERGISTQRAHTNYSPPPLASYMASANRNTVIFAQIETRQGVRNASEILGTDGVDGVFVGPNDLAGDCGVPGEIDAPIVGQCIASVVKSAKQTGKYSGIITGDIELIKTWRAQGMSVFSCNSEIGMLMNAAKKVAQFLAQI